MRKFIGWLCYFIATGFFTGRLGRNGKGGGTWGSVLALLIQFLLLFWIQPVWWAYPIITVGVFVLGMAVVGPAERYAYERYGEVPRHDGKVGMYDQNSTDIDEVLGMFIANFLFLIIFSFFDVYNPPIAIGATVSLLFGFGTFRYFDINKKGAARSMESRSNPDRPFGYATALSIMLDDLFAALPVTIVSLLVVIGIFHVYWAVMFALVAWLFADRFHLI